MLLMGKSTISMAIFNSYVSLPEGMFELVKSVNIKQLVPSYTLLGRERDLEKINMKSGNLIKHGFQLWAEPTN